MPFKSCEHAVTLDSERMTVRSNPLLIHRYTHALCRKYPILISLRNSQLQVPPNHILTKKGGGAGEYLSSYLASRIRRRQAALQPVLPHFGLHVRADAEVRARLGGAQQDVSGFAVLRKIRDSVRGIEFTGSEQLARAGEAAALVADGRQIHAGTLGLVPQVLRGSRGNHARTIRCNQRHLKRFVVSHSAFGEFKLRGRRNRQLSRQPRNPKNSALWIVEAAVLAVRRLPRSAAPEVARRNRLPVAFVSEQFDEPRFVFDLLVQNARGHVVRPGVFAERHVADLDPAADRAPLGLEQQREDVDGRRRIGQLRRGASGLIVERGQIVRQFAAQFVNSRDDQFPVRAIFQACVLANLLVVFVARKVHAEDGVIVVGAREFRGSVGNEHLNQFLDVHAARANHFHAHALRYVAMLHNLIVSHRYLALQTMKGRRSRAQGLIYGSYGNHRKKTSQQSRARVNAWVKALARGAASTALFLRRGPRRKFHARGRGAARRAALAVAAGAQARG